MVEETNGYTPCPGADALARRLLESARQDPSLLGRTRPNPEPDFDSADMFLRPAAAPLLAVSNGSSIALYRQCHHLASVAVAAAEDAEDAFQRARDSFCKAQRAMLLCSALGIVGLIIGLAAAVISAQAPTATATAELTGEPTPPQVGVNESAIQPPADPDPSGHLPTLHAAYVPPLPLPPDLIRQPPETVSAQQATASSAPMVSYVSSAPWPSSQPPINRPSHPRQRVVYPPVFTDLRQNIGVLLRLR